MAHDRHGLTGFTTVPGDPNQILVLPQIFGRPASTEIRYPVCCRAPFHSLISPSERCRCIAETHLGSQEKHHSGCGHRLILCSGCCWSPNLVSIRLAASAIEPARSALEGAE
jgi:hypothetical protein